MSSRGTGSASANGSAPLHDPGDRRPARVSAGRHAAAACLANHRSSSATACERGSVLIGRDDRERRRGSVVERAAVGPASRLDHLDRRRGATRRRAGRRAPAVAGRRRRPCSGPGRARRRPRPRRRRRRRRRPRLATPLGRLGGAHERPDGRRGPPGRRSARRRSARSGGAGARRRCRRRRPDRRRSRPGGPDRARVGGGHGSSPSAERTTARLGPWRTRCVTITPTPGRGRRPATRAGGPGRGTPGSSPCPPARRAPRRSRRS